MRIDLSIVSVFYVSIFAVVAVLINLTNEKAPMTETQPQHETRGLVSLVFWMNFRVCEAAVRSLCKRYCVWKTSEPSAATRPKWRQCGFPANISQLGLQTHPPSLFSHPRFCTLRRKKSTWKYKLAESNWVKINSYSVTTWSFNQHWHWILYIQSTKFYSKLQYIYNTINKLKTSLKRKVVLVCMYFEQAGRFNTSNNHWFIFRLPTFLLINKLFKSNHKLNESMKPSVTFVLSCTDTFCQACFYTTTNINTFFFFSRSQTIY